MLYSFPFIMMSLATLCTTASFGAFFHLPLFIEHLGGTKGDIGIIMGVFALSSVLCRPWISEMIDRAGRKRSYTYGSLAMVALPPAYQLIHGSMDNVYFPLILLRVIHGAGLAVCFTSAITYATDIVPKNRLNEGIGIFGITGLAGMAVGPVIAEIVIRDFGFQTFFWFVSGIAALGLIVHLPLPESYSDRNHHTTVTFYAVLVKKKVLSVALLAVLFGFGLSASGSFVAPFAHDCGVNFISLYYICYSGAAIITRLFGGKMADRFGENSIIPYALLVTAAGLMGLIVLRDWIVLAISGVLTGIGHGLLFPCLNALMVRDEPITIRGKLTGIFTGGIDTGLLVGSILLGFVGEWAGYRTLFFTAGFALVAGFAIFQSKTMKNEKLKQI